MPWNIEPRPTFAELAEQGGQIHGSSLPSGLLQRRNPMAEIIGLIGQQAFDYLQKRQQDQRANELLATLDSQKATAVDPSLAGTGTPDTSLSTAQAAQNAALGYPTKAQTPQMGGTGELANRIEALKMKKLIDSATPEMVKDKDGNWVTPTQANYDLRSRKEVVPSVSYTLPDGRVIQVTPDTAAKYMHGAGKDNPSALLDKDLSKQGLSAQDLSGVDFTSPGAVKYMTVDKDGNPRQISTEEADKQIADSNNANPVNAVTSVNGRDISVPYAQWKGFARRYQNLNRSSASQPGVTAYKSTLSQGDVQQASDRLASENPTVAAAPSTPVLSASDPNIAKAQAAVQQIQSSGLPPDEQARRIHAVRQRLSDAGYDTSQL